MSKSDFNERREARIDRLENAADRARKRSDQKWKQSDELAKPLWGGEPIKIGHHSEHRHRRQIEKVHDAAFKAIDEEKKAKEYELRAEAARNNTAIFSDDPDATEKLADKIERLEKRQELMKAANKAIRKKDIHALADLGYSGADIERLMDPGRFGGPGYASFELSNNSATIRNAKQRLARLEKQNAQTNIEVTYDEIRILQNYDENRTQIFFPTKPDESVRLKLKKQGFRWSPLHKCWQRHLSRYAFELAKGFFPYGPSNDPKAERDRFLNSLSDEELEQYI